MISHHNFFGKLCFVSVFQRIGPSVFLPNYLQTLSICWSFHNAYRIRAREEVFLLQFAEIQIVQQIQWRCRTDYAHFTHKWFIDPASITRFNVVLLNVRAFTHTAGCRIPGSRHWSTGWTCEILKIALLRVYPNPLISFSYEGTVWSQGAESIPHQPYLADLAPCNFRLFPHMKMKLKGCCFRGLKGFKRIAGSTLSCHWNCI